MEQVGGNLYLDPIYVYKNTWIGVKIGGRMSNWTHSICMACWNQKYPNREPAVCTGELVETCCFCEKITTEGIYIRYNSFELGCKHLTGDAIGDR